MNELQVNAAMAELNAINQFLTQRCVNYAGDLALAKSELAIAKREIEELKKGDGNGT